MCRLRLTLFASLVAACTTGGGSPSVDGGSIDATVDASRIADAGLDAPTDAATSIDVSAPPGDASVTLVPLAMPGGAPIIGADLTYGTRIGRVILPVSNALQLLDPTTLALEVIPGFGPTWDAGPGVDGGGNPPYCSFDAGPGSGPCYPGTTSADDGNGVVYAIDRRSEMISVVDVAARTIGASAHLAGPPDYIRFSPSTSEVWVTEPAAAQIEVLSVGSGSTLSHVATIATPTGCESIGIDTARGHAYSNAGGHTVVYDLTTHAVSTSWSNGCTGSSGLAVDPRGFVVVVCDDGHFVALDATSGAQLSTAAAPMGQLDVIAISTTLHHVYGQSNLGHLVALGLDAHGTLTMLGAPMSSPFITKSVAADTSGHIYLIDRGSGVVMIVADPFPATM